MVSHITESWDSITIDNNYVSFYCRSCSGQILTLITLESKSNLADVNARHVHSAQMLGALR